MENDDKMDVIIILPIKKGFVSLNNVSKGATSTAVFRLHNNEIIRGNIIQHFSHTDNSPQLPKGLASKVFNGENLQNYWVAILNVKDEFEMESDYKNGKFVSLQMVKEKIEKPEGSEISSSSQRCTSTYLVTWYSDGSSDWNLLFTICNGTGSSENCNETKLAFGKSFSRCNGGGLSGGGSNNNTCTDAHTDEGNTIVDNLLNTFSASDDKVSITTIYNSLNNRTRRYSWIFLTAINGDWTSNDRSDQSKDNNGTWKFTSLSHVDEIESSTYIGVDIAVAIKNIAPTWSDMSALMNFDAEAKISLAFHGCTIKRTRPFHCRNYWTVGEGN